jgi:hypothetical protein
MKSFYLLVAMAIMLPLCLISKPLDRFSLYKDAPVESIDLNKVGIKLQDVYEVKVKDAPEPQMAFKLLDTDLEYFWSTLWEGVTPFAYEPKSKTIMYVTTSRKTVDGWADCFVYLHFSQDGGKNWTKTEVYTKKRQMAFFPSVSVLNPKGETDPAKFKYVITITPFIPKPTPNDTTYYAEGNMYLFFNGKDGWSKAEEYQEAAPANNNIGGVQEWNATQKRSIAVSSTKGDYFYIYGMLSPLDGYQYGAYGLAYIEFTGDFPDPLSQIPPQWNTKAFRDPGSLTSSWNAPIRMGADNLGNIYAFVYNMFPDNPDQRVPAFSKSTDNGKTWSDFSQMPFSRIRDFLVEWKHNQALDNYTTPYPYTTWDAVVTGPDEFSIFTRLNSAVGTTVDDAVFTGHYIESSYKNGSWQPIKRVGELNASPIKISNVASTGTKDSLQASNRYNEIEVAKTADGKSLVVKYVDVANENSIGVLNTPVSLIGNPTVVIDSLNCTDIFFVYRNLTDGAWKPAQNATQDLWYNKGTYMPPVVESLSEIPVVEFITQEFQNTANPRFSYPYFLQNLIGDRSSAALPVSYQALVAVYDMLNPVPISNGIVQRAKGLKGQSVIENLPFSLNEVSPNPANDFATLSFNMDYTADVTVNLHNTMGQVIKNVFAGNAQQGLNTINILTNDLPAGAYFYTVNVNGKTQTKLLNVIR